MFSYDPHLRYVSTSRIFTVDEYKTSSRAFKQSVKRADKELEDQFKRSEIIRPKVDFIFVSTNEYFHRIWLTNSSGDIINSSCCTLYHDISKNITEFARAHRIPVVYRVKEKRD